MNFDFILPACNAEKLLVTTLGFPSSNHQNGDGNVINILDNKRNIQKKTVLIGIMDKSIGASPSHMPRLYIDIEKGPFRVLLKHRKNSNRYIIFIDEVFEEWIQKVGNSKNVPRPYPNNDYKFKSEMKSGKDKKIINYLNNINNSGASPFIKIKGWILRIQKNTLQI